ncbi:MAG: hypothetical protein KDC67_13215 [Ignavibacteriae bacterium]|nr:hypothetical protein [Ignavibacteriota bacterium]
MKLFNILPLIAAAIIIVFNKWILDYVEQKYRREDKPFNRRYAFILLMCAVGMLIIKAVLF